MSQKIIKRQTVILFLSVLMLGLFIFATYFYWVPDTLIDFVPDNILLYSHLNLSKFHYSGYLAQKWLKANDDRIENIFREHSVDFSIINSLEEIALFVSAEDNSGVSQLELILKSKIGLNDLQKMLPSSCFVEKISDKVFRISFHINSDKTRDLTSFSRENRFCFISPFDKTPSLVNGYIDLGVMSVYLPAPKIPMESRFVKFSVLYSSPQNNKLFFEIENKNTFDHPLFSSQENDFSVLGNDFDFVFVFPRQESINELEDRIKVYLASQNPKERKVILPDNSSFVEIIVDTEDFVFKKEGLIDYWKESPDYGFEVALSEDEESTFFSNNHILLKEIILTEQKENSKSALYWDVNNTWLQRLALKEKNQKIEGFLELK